MCKCSWCGEEFDLEHARRSIGRRYGAGTYDEYYPDGDICENCASGEISADVAAGAELMELMGDMWDDD